MYFYNLEIGRHYLFVFVPDKLFLEFLEALALGLGQLCGEEYESCGAYDGVNPEGAVATQRAVQQRERVSEGERTHPQGECARGHCDGTDAVGEYLGNQHPGHGAERHGVAGDGRYDKDDHEETRHVQVVARTQYSIYHGESAGSYEHQFLAAETVDGVYGHEGEYHVGYARQHDIEQHLSKIISGIGKNGTNRNPGAFVKTERIEC